MNRHPHSLKRQKKLIKNKEFLLKLFSEKCLELTPENYSDVYRQVDNSLLEKYKSSTRSHKIARLEFARYIKRFNRLSNQNYPVPATPVRHESPHPSKILRL